MNLDFKEVNYASVNRTGKGISSPRIFASGGTVTFLKFNAHSGQEQQVDTSPLLEFKILTSSLTELKVDVEKLTLDAIERFQAIAEVDEIYQSVSNGRVNFYVFSNEESYDDQLLDRLIDVELELAQLYPHLKQTYEFTPSALVSDLRCVTGDRAEKVFSRNSG